MAFSGNLSSISLAGILQLLGNENKTGLLRVWDAASEYQIILLKGGITYAIESRRESRLGQLLIEDGVVSAEDMRVCLAAAKDQKQALGKVLVDRGLLPDETLYDYIYRQVSDILFLLMQWRDGQFEFTDQRFNLRWLVPIRLNNMNLIMDALRRVDETVKAQTERPPVPPAEPLAG